MATIIRVSDPSQRTCGVALNLDDLAVEADQHLEQVRAEAEEIVAEARRQADSIRRQAAEEGAQAAVRVVEQMVDEQTTPALSALRQAAADLQRAKQAWLSHWESSAVHLATAIAAKVVRRELVRQPDIALALVREALELAAGSPNIRLHLNPEDYKSLGARVQALVDAMSGLGGAEVEADATVSRGGCRLETRFGTIDQQFESQLSRIEEELTG